MKLPDIKTSLPGPRAAALIDTDRAHVSPSYTRVYPLVAERGEGLWIRDPDGNIFLDFTSGIAVCATGHCHPLVVNAIKKQADQLLHMSGTDFYYTPQIALAEKLAQRGYNEEDYAEAIRLLLDKGWIEQAVGRWQITGNGRALRDVSEMVTDRIFFAGFRALNDRELERLNELLVNLSQRLQQDESAPHPS